MSVYEPSTEAFLDQQARFAQQRGDSVTAQSFTNARMEHQRLRGLLHAGSRTGMTVSDRANWMIEVRALLDGATVQPNVAHYPIEFGPSDARRLECAFCHTTRHVQDQWERATSPAPAAKCACAEYYPELPHHPDCPTRNAAQQPTAPTSGGHDGD